MSAISVSVFFVIMILLILVFALAIPIGIGVYVYKDAKSRNMNASLWTLISILVPGFIGLIAYLIVRTQNNYLLCPECQTPVRQEFTICPSCGTHLKSCCEACSTPLEAGWKVCPHCGAPVPEDLSTHILSEAPSKKSFPIPLLLLIIIPFFLVIAGLIASVCYLRVSKTDTMHYDYANEYSFPDQYEFDIIDK